MNYKGTKDKIFSCQCCGDSFEFRGYSNNHIFCSVACSVSYQKANKEKVRENRYQEWLAGKLSGIKNPRSLIREFVTRRDGYQCSVCGISEWNGKPISLWCDHIDGDATNNQPDNFRLVCPNCDSQSETFGAKNYGNGRKARGLPQYG